MKSQRKKAGQPKQVKDQTKTVNEQETNLLETFWKEFQLSPRKSEQVVLTDIKRLTLIAFGPLLLLTLISLFSALLTYKNGEIKPFLDMTFRDFGDPIFTYISLSLLLGSVIYRYRWYPSIREAFQSLLENEVLHDTNDKKVSESEMLKFLKVYNAILHSNKRYILPAIFVILLLGFSLFITFSRNFWGQMNLHSLLDVLDILYILTRWVAAPIAWAYAGSLGLWTVWVTAKAVMDLTPRFQINVQPLHSDKAGGLKILGDLCSNVGLLVLVIAIPSASLAAQGTLHARQIIRCGDDMQNLIYAPTSRMTADQLAQCMSYYPVDQNQTSDAILTDLQSQMDNGASLKDLASAYVSVQGHSFQRDVATAKYNIYYFMEFILCIILLFAVFIVIWPLWDIHIAMVEDKQKKEHEINSRLGNLYDELTGLIKQDKLDEADKIKTKIKFLSNELAETQKYPRWPISSLPVLRTYLSSSLISALLTYILSLLNVTMSTELGGVVKEFINSAFGGK